MTNLDRQLISQGCRCFVCQKLMHPDAATIMHIIPRALGGTRRMENIVAGHQDCNEAAGMLTVGSPRFAKWLKLVMKYGLRKYTRRDYIR